MVFNNWIIKYRGEVLGASHDMSPEKELPALKKSDAIEAGEINFKNGGNLLRSASSIKYPFILEYV